MAHGNKFDFERRDFLRLCGLAGLGLGADFFRWPMPGSPAATRIRVEGQPTNAYTFGSFVVCPHNQEAFAAARAVAQKPFFTYNPLFIHGAAGMGKTHLLLALGQHLAASDPARRVLYLPATCFAHRVNEATAGLRAARHFRERFRHADVILLDDVHHLADETVWDHTSPGGPYRIIGSVARIALLELFGEMYGTGSKLFVFSAACAPDAMPGMSPPLMARFAWGLVSQIRRSATGLPFSREIASR